MKDLYGGKEKEGNWMAILYTWRTKLISRAGWNNGSVITTDQVLEKIHHCLTVFDIVCDIATFDIVVFDFVYYSRNILPFKTNWFHFTKV